MFNCEFEWVKRGKWELRIVSPMEILLDFLFNQVKTIDDGGLTMLTKYYNKNMVPIIRIGRVTKEKSFWTIFNLEGENGTLSSH